MLTKAFVTTGVLQVLVPRYCVTSPSPSSCRKGRWCFLHKPHQQLPPGQPMDHGDTVVDAVGERCMWCPSCKKSTKPWWGPKCGNAKRLNQLVTYDFFLWLAEYGCLTFLLSCVWEGSEIIGIFGISWILSNHFDSPSFLASCVGISKAVHMTLLASKANLGLTGVEATVHHYGAVASAYEIAGKWQKALQLMDRVHQPNQVVRVVLIWMSLVLHIFSFCLILCTQPDYIRIMCLYGFNYTYATCVFVHAKSIKM